jgi:hypothetical protein
MSVMRSEVSVFVRRSRSRVDAPARLFRLIHTLACLGEVRFGQKSKLTATISFYVWKTWTACRGPIAFPLPDRRVSALADSQFSIFTELTYQPPVAGVA